MGSANLARRLAREEQVLARKRFYAQATSAWKKMLNKDVLLAKFLQRTGLWRRGRKNFRAIEVVENRVSLPGLPHEWSGFRLLQISDLHTDLDRGLLRPLANRLAGISFDRAVITGDFQDLLLRPHDRAIECVKKLVPFLGEAPLAVPGNHDLASLVVRLEAVGLRFLLNEALVWQRGRSRFALCGIDDPQTFQGDDMERALHAVPPGSFRVLLAHSPVCYLRAAAAGFDLLLCGHTHGGQICFPGGVPFIRNARVPKPLFAGSWQWDNLAGYTSRGTGGCGVPVRFFCRPEVTLHIFEAA